MMTVLLAFIALFAPQDSALGGVIVDSATKRPVAGATVMLIRLEAIAGAVVVSTDDRGRFAFPAVAPATYRVLAEHDDYVRELSEEIAIESGRAPAAASIALTPTAVISGRVTDEFGEPAGKVYVRALTTRVVAEARTNDLGEYRLFGLAPGAYVISAERYSGPSIQGTRIVTPTPPCPDCRGEGAFSQTIAGVLAGGGFIDPRALAGQTYPAVFYPGTTERSGAGAITVKPGARIDAIDLRLIVR